MDQSEYKLIKNNYSSDDLKKIDEFNNFHLQKALELLKYNRNQLQTNDEYAKLDIKDRIMHIQKNNDFMQFCKSYPVVSKYIIAFGLFSSKAFIKYLNWTSNVRPSDEIRAKLVSQPREQELWKNKYRYGLYVKYLYQEKQSHSNLSDINNLYLSIVESLNEETNEFFDKYEKELKKLEETKSEYTEERKNRIKEQIKIKLTKQ